jgi:hypothetical protein
VFEVGDQIFNIRVRAETSKFAASGKNYITMDREVSIKIYNSSLGPTADAGFLYGYVFFRQKKDASIRRGYFQVKKIYEWFV